MIDRSVGYLGVGYAVGEDTPFTFRSRGKEGGGGGEEGMGGREKVRKPSQSQYQTSTAFILLSISSSSSISLSLSETFFMDQKLFELCLDAEFNILSCV